MITMTSIAIPRVAKRSRTWLRQSRRLRISHPLEARIPHRDVAAWLELDRERIAALIPVVNAAKRVARRTIDRWGGRHDVSPFAMTYLPFPGISRVARLPGG